MSGRGEKKLENALNYSPLRWLISIEALGQSGSFSMRFPFHLNRDGGAQLKAYQFVKSESKKTWSGQSGWLLRNFPVFLLAETWSGRDKFQEV